MEPPANPQRVAIFGATSDIAIAYARQRAEAGDLLVLIGRDRAKLAAEAADLGVRGAAAVVVETADFSVLSSLPQAVEAAWTAFAGCDAALVAYGSLPDQKAVEQDPGAIERALNLNFVSPCMLCELLASRFETQRSGALAVITSVAGDRGRKSNYIYGAAKGGLQRYLEGLQHRLHASNVRVLDIRPGFVASKMTAHLPQNGLLWTAPSRVAADISRALQRRQAILYTPWFWRYIMMVIRWLPRTLFHRTSF